ncbi:MAG: hypothetical protein AAF065_00415 [Verrucomicrobiota bacterium]
MSFAYSGSRSEAGQAHDNILTILLRRDDDFRWPVRYDAAEMKRIRALHLYLGCFFAPLLSFFCISGIWQMFSLHRGAESPKALAVLSTLHTTMGLKSGDNLSYWFTDFMTIAMSLALLLTIALGVYIGFKSANRVKALYALSLGILIPVVAISISYFAVGQ